MDVVLIGRRAEREALGGLLARAADGCAACSASRRPSRALSGGSRPALASAA
jgi:hypothetical protein